MGKTIYLGTLAGLDLRARSSIWLAYPALCLALAVIGVFVLGMSLAEALVCAAACGLLHFAGELWHNLGHAAAARCAGHPMIGVTFWGLLAASRYPAEEGQLPPAVHIRRALGGPLGSALLTALAGPAWLALQTAPRPFYWVSLFFFLDNLLVYSLGAFLPLGFTDGSTLLYWLRQR